MQATDARTYEGRFPVAVRCGECNRLRMYDPGSLLGIAYRHIDGVGAEAEVVWSWAPMTEPRSPKSMFAHRPGPIAYRLDAAGSADAPPVVAACKNQSHPAYRVPRLRLAGMAGTAFERGSESFHIGRDFATIRVGRATRVQRGTSKAR